MTSEHIRGQYLYQEIKHEYTLFLKLNRTSFYFYFGISRTGSLIDRVWVTCPSLGAHNPRSVGPTAKQLPAVPSIVPKTSVLRFPCLPCLFPSEPLCLSHLWISGGALTQSCNHLSLSLSLHPGWKALWSETQFLLFCTEHKSWHRKGI